MLTTPHHATVKKANQAGLTIELDSANQQYVARWADGNLTLTGHNAPGLVEDLRTAKMIRLEYRGCKLVQTKKGWVVKYQGEEIGSGETVVEAWDMALDYLEDTEETENAQEDDGEGDDEPELEAGDEEGEGDDGEGRSVVKRRYKKQYRPFKMTCGDELSQLITQHVVRENSDGEMRIDPRILKNFAVANSVWVDSYSNLNVGMRRMNIANRLRAMVKKGYQIVWAK